MTILATVVVMAAFFTAIGWRVAGRTGRRNLEAFEGELADLAARGFERVSKEDLPASIRTIGKVRRVVARGVSPRVWLVESEHLALAINSLWPTRYALIDTGQPVPTGQLSPKARRGASDGADYASTFADSEINEDFVQLLRSALDPLFPQVAVGAEGTLISVQTVHVAKAPGREARPPISLTTLAEVADKIGDGLVRSTDKLPG